MCPVSPQEMLPMPENERLRSLAPRELRELARVGKLNRRTAGLAAGHVQANLAIVPADLAFDLLLFCQRNPKPCPLLDVTEPGDPEPKWAAPGADLRTDLGLYSIYRFGEKVAEVEDLRGCWRDDLVAFMLGCSFTFDSALLAARVPMHHLMGSQHIPAYISGIECRPTRRLHGRMVVSMRPVPAREVPRVVQITARHPYGHGAPIHVGDPGIIGIEDLSRPDFGDPPRLEAGDVPVFWGCGITPQAVAMDSKPELMITHARGRMFLTDLCAEGLAT